MNKYIYLLIALFAIPSLIFSATHLNIQNASVSELQQLSHTVSRISTFKYTPKTSVVNYDAGGVNIAAIAIVNNTLDGFTLTVASAQGGVMAPDSTEDGEQDIPFSISMEATGTVGTGVDTTFSIAQSALSDTSAPANILTVTSGEQSSATNLNLEVDISLDSTVEDQMSMAGSYTDTLTFTYTDL